MHSRRFPITTPLVYWWVLIVGTLLVLVLIIFIVGSLIISTRRLRKERDFTLNILETAGALIFVLDKEGKIVQFNRACQNLTGYSFDQVEGLTVNELLFIPDKDNFNQNLAFDQFPAFFESYWIANDNTHHHITWSTSNIKDSKGSIQWTIYTGIDITDQIQAERALSSEKERLAVTLRSISDGIITTDSEGSIVLFNKVAEELTGCMQAAAIGKHLEEVFCIYYEETRKRCESPVDYVLKKGQIYSLPYNTILKDNDGKERIIIGKAAPITEKDGRIIGVVVAFRDITEQRRMEEELLKARKLDSISILAGGIAHDFNNILTGILGNISLARLYVIEKENIEDLLSEIEHASLQAKQLTQQLLTFSKGGTPIKKTASIGELLTDTANFVIRGSTIHCEFTIPDNIWQVEIDAGQISQVINNIIINATQSMPQGGIIRINADNIALDKNNIFNIKAGKYVKISIKDEGVGIPQEHLHQIFDPYFTTKQAGSGLGLAISYSVIKKHGGYITADSELKVGTTFYIYLPAIIKKKQHRVKHELTIVSGKGKILVMDDEKIVRKTLGNLLQHLGYEVVFAINGSEALEMYMKAKEASAPFDAVIMDLTIPGGMGGKETIEKIIKLDPKTKVIVSSGYSSDPVLADYKRYGFCASIVKPYKIEELSEVLSEVIK